MGGYVSLPVCYAARVLRVPIVLHEQNIVMGLANRVCRPVAKRIAVSFEETLSSAGRNALVTGNPVLPRLLAASIPRPEALRRFGLEPDRRTLLVFGGSRGAGRVNQAGVELAAAWRERADVQVLHITGREHHDRVAGEVERSGPVSLIYRTAAYVDDMSSAYAACDLVVCRGGATTVAELTAVGLPSIIVPYPHHRDRQQERHARVLERAGAARVLQDAIATGEAVARVAGELLADGATLDRMGRAAKGLGRPDAAGVVAALVEEVAA
jgi:UDP-N-acetylglucosamine--N-acetylmuramyl-(pentapeptide) pyrophosphoryl-undecaprenol N-acetylglucosamine transferase